MLTEKWLYVSRLGRTNRFQSWTKWWHNGPIFVDPVYEQVQYKICCSRNTRMAYKESIWYRWHRVNMSDIVHAGEIYNCKSGDSCCGQHSYLLGVETTILEGETSFIFVS
jgi:hypothetical protein